MMKFSTTIAASLCLLFVASCTTGRTVKHHGWIEPSKFENEVSTPSTENKSDHPEYKNLQQDFRSLQMITENLQDISINIAALCKDFKRNEFPYFSAKQGDRAGRLLFRYTKAQDDLYRLIDDSKNIQTQDPTLKAQAAVLGLAASAQLSWIRSDIGRQFSGKRSCQKLMNSEFPHYDIERGTFSELIKEVTKPAHLKSLYTARQTLDKALGKDNPISQLHASNPDYARLIDHLPLLYIAANRNVAVLLGGHHSRKFTPMRNRVLNSKMTSVSTKINREIDDALHSAQGTLYMNVGRVKNPTKTITRFSPAQIQQIKSLLEPGDVILSFTEGYVSNVFLPGKFKHVSTYIGSPEDRRRLGITDESLSSLAASDKQFRLLSSAANTKYISTGENADVIESVGEGVPKGVRIYSLEKTLVTHVNRLAVLRPRTSQEQKKNQLVDLFRYMGSPYDFRFDFSDSTRNGCTELIYRTLKPNETFDFQLSKQRGHWVLTADDIANYYINTQPDAFEFILLADRGSNKGQYNAAIHTNDDGRNRLRKLMMPKK